MSNTQTNQTMNTRRESLRHRLNTLRKHGVRFGLSGCPEGGWPETRQARQRILESLPYEDRRTYTVDQLIDALYFVNNGRYWLRDEFATV